MAWQLAIGLSVTANIAMLLIQRRYSQKSSAPTTFPPAASYLFGVAPIGIIVGLFMSHHIHWTWWIALLLVSNSIIMAISNWLGFIAVKRMPVAQLQTISQFYEIVVVALGWIILKEGLNKFQLIGAILLFIAVLIAIRAPVKTIDVTPRKVHLRSVLLALSAATTLGIALVIEKAALGHMDLGAYFIFGYSAQTLGLLLLASKDVKSTTLKNFGKREIKWSATMGGALGVCGVFYGVAIVQSNNISLVTAVASITLPLVALAAHVILKERDNQKLLWIGLSIGFLGLIVSAFH